jgi:putative heme iron utilization protein
VDENDRELINRLFVCATAMLEDSIEAAVAGQSGRADAAQLSVLGKHLQDRMQEISTLAEATQIIASRVGRSAAVKND